MEPNWFNKIRHSKDVIVYTARDGHKKEIYFSGVKATGEIYKIEIDKIRNTALVYFYPLSCQGTSYDCIYLGRYWGHKKDYLEYRFIKEDGNDIYLEYLA
jgi:hypothetical protein